MHMASARLDSSTDTLSETTTRFEALFTHFYSRIHRIVSGLVGSSEADDIAQEVFLKLYHHGNLGAADERIGAWLYRVAVNTAYNHLRSRRRQTSYLERAGQLAQVETIGRQADLNPAQAITAREETDQIRAALASLPENQRAVIVLRQSGLSYAEIATTIGIRPGSVGTLLARAEERLRQHYRRLAGTRPPGSQPAGGQHEPLS